eukprot:271497_1
MSTQQTSGATENITQQTMQPPPPPPPTHSQIPYPTNYHQMQYYNHPMQYYNHHSNFNTNTQQSIKSYPMAIDNDTSRQTLNFDRKKKVHKRHGKLLKAILESVDGMQNKQNIRIEVIGSIYMDPENDKSDSDIESDIEAANKPTKSKNKDNNAKNSKAKTSFTDQQFEEALECALLHTTQHTINKSTVKTFTSIKSYSTVGKIMDRLVDLGMVTHPSCHYYFKPQIYQGEQIIVKNKMEYTQVNVNFEISDEKVKKIYKNIVLRVNGKRKKLLQDKHEETTKNKKTNNKRTTEIPAEAPSTKRQKISPITDNNTNNSHIE